MLQAANTGLFNPLVPKAHNSECQNLQITNLLIKSVKVSKSQLKLLARPCLASFQMRLWKVSGSSRKMINLPNQTPKLYFQHNCSTHEH